MYIDGMSFIHNMFSEKYERKKLFELVVLSNATGI
jgi:hypothetical protein